MADEELSTDDLDAILNRINEFESTLGNYIKSLKEDSDEAQKVASGGGLKQGLNEARKRARDCDSDFKVDTTALKETNTKIEKAHFPLKK